MRHPYPVAQRKQPFRDSSTTQPPPSLSVPRRVGIVALRRILLLRLPILRAVLFRVTRCCTLRYRALLRRLGLHWVKGKGRLALACGRRHRHSEAHPAGVADGRRYRRRCMILGWTALALAFGYLLAAGALARYGRRPLGAAERYDAIVVAGCAVRPDGSPSPALAKRAAVALSLYRAGHADRVVFTGGVGSQVGPDGPSEAAAAAAWAVSRGLPSGAVVLEEKSTSTEENARFAAQRIGAEARVLVVSDAYHVYRCERVFARHFRSARGAGSLGTPSARWRGAFREVLAVAAYAALGRLG